MELANQIFFVIFSLIAFALLLSTIPQFQVNRENLPSVYWPLSIGFYSLCCFSFGIALWVNKFFLTVANTSLIISAIALLLFYRNLNGRPFNKIQTILVFTVPIIVGFFYDGLRVAPNTFQQRVALITGFQEFFLAWQAWELKKYSQKDTSRIIPWLLALTLFTLLGNMLRTFRILTGDGPTNIFLYVEDGWALALRWFVYASNILAFMAIGVFKVEAQLIQEHQISNALERVQADNQKITELLKEKERLIYGLMKANKTAAAGALSASIAHELNQPLGASNLNIQYLKMKLEKGALNPELGKEILDSLEQDNQRAATIVKSLRSIFTEVEVRPQRLQVGELISRVLDIVKPELKAKNIQIQLRVDERLVIEANSAEVEQVLLNLINNAIQALANSGRLARRISIEALQVGDVTQLSVADNGDGVDPEYRPHLFELLSTTKQTGMGLGLWLCKHIITRYGGKILYEDVLGGGARFTVEFPPGLTISSKGN